MNGLNPLSRIFALLIFFGYGCANRIPVDGGPRDTTPPRIVKSIPDSAQRNFNQTKLYFTFDEYVDLKDGGTSILFSPPLPKPATFIVRKKTLEVSLPDSLEKNTTYTISFGKSIVDVNEGNVFKNQFRVFSTGAEIDSLQLNGRLVNALNGKPVAGAKALLYTELADTTPYKQFPRYFAMSDEQGNFAIQNIKQGSYFLVAQTDENANLLYDNPEDLLGFVADKIAVDTSFVQAPAIRMFRNQGKKQKVLKKQFEIPGKLTVKFAKPPVNPEFKLLAPFQSDSVLYLPTEKDDSLQLFLPRFKSDSLWLQITDGDFRDTLRLNLRGVFAKSLMQKGKSAVDTTFSIKSATPGNLLSIGDTFKLALNCPLKSIDTALFILRKDSANIPFKVKSDAMNVLFEFRFAEGEQLELTALPGAFTDRYLRQNDTLRFSIKTARDKDMGSATVKLINTRISKKGILQLLSSNGNVLKQIILIGDGKYSFQGLQPGTYQLRLIDDANENGRWDTGSFENKLQPEPSFNYAETITIRAGWDVETDWNLSDTATRKENRLGNKQAD